MKRTRQNIVMLMVTLTVATGTVMYVTGRVKQLRFERKVEKLNIAMPQNFSGMANVRRTIREQPELANAYVRFYRRYANLFPDRADGWAMLGMIYFHAGELDRARDSLERAHRLAPDYFWFAYDLGVIDLRQGRYREAAAMLRTSLQADATSLQDFINGSTIIFRSIFIDAPQVTQGFQQRWNQGRETAMVLIVLSEYLAERKEKGPEAAEEFLVRTYPQQANVIRSLAGALNRMEIHAF